uniref:Uncharacterized protein n=1 Tax=Chromera velia CCMP2878 TaxID=1169474 RepID=A0A0G4I376_9ALVE|eukprot:Cvel_10571.t1-p1 / transcript=Cvel_10571.t1 / gene=Cvel_10571 / organism=Chromera_velia_CCMP2878 / gene_product=hypothetical protein / transcript_product=hypothetical protein / location=Cvel_scaffold640:52449-73627(+) / protein_length=3152 / sequence_SO=supercontig / SO=protein_coding / is_pseudo=false
MLVNGPLRFDHFDFDLQHELVELLALDSHKSAGGSPSPMLLRKKLPQLIESLRRSLRSNIKGTMLGIKRAFAKIRDAEVRKRETVMKQVRIALVNVKRVHRARVTFLWTLIRSMVWLTIARLRLAARVRRQQFIFRMGAGSMLSVHGSQLTEDTVGTDPTSPGGGGGGAGGGSSSKKKGQPNPELLEKKTRWELLAAQTMGLIQKGLLEMREAVPENRNRLNALINELSKAERVIMNHQRRKEAREEAEAEAEREREAERIREETERESRARMAELKLRDLSSDEEEDEDGGGDMREGNFRRRTAFNAPHFKHIGEALTIQESAKANEKKIRQQMAEELARMTREEIMRDLRTPRNGDSSSGRLRKAIDRRNSFAYGEERAARRKPPRGRQKNVREFEDVDLRRRPMEEDEENVDGPAQTLADAVKAAEKELELEMQQALDREKKKVQEKQRAAEREKERLLAARKAAEQRKKRAMRRASQIKLEMEKPSDSKWPLLLNVGPVKNPFTVAPWIAYSDRLVRLQEDALSRRQATSTKKKKKKKKDEKEEEMQKAPFLTYPAFRPAHSAITKLNVWFGKYLSLRTELFLRLVKAKAGERVAESLRAVVGVVKTQQYYKGELQQLRGMIRLLEGLIKEEEEKLETAAELERLRREAAGKDEENQMNRRDSFSVMRRLSMLLLNEDQQKDGTGPGGDREAAEDSFREQLARQVHHLLEILEAAVATLYLKNDKLGAKERREGKKKAEDVMMDLLEQITVLVREKSARIRAKAKYLIQLSMEKAEKERGAEDSAEVSPILPLDEAVKQAVLQEILSLAEQKISKLREDLTVSKRTDLEGLLQQTRAMGELNERLESLELMRVTAHRELVGDDNEGDGQSPGRRGLPPQILGIAQKLKAGKMRLGEMHAWSSDWKDKRENFEIQILGYLMGGDGTSSPSPKPVGSGSFDAGEDQQGGRTERSDQESPSVSPSSHRSSKTLRFKLFEGEGSDSASEGEQSELKDLEREMELLASGIARMPTRRLNGKERESSVIRTAALMDDVLFGESKDRKGQPTRRGTRRLTGKGRSGKGRRGTQSEPVLGDERVQFSGREKASDMIAFFKDKKAGESLESMRHRQKISQNAETIGQSRLKKAAQILSRNQGGKRRSLLNFSPIHTQSAGENAAAKSLDDLLAKAEADKKGEKKSGSGIQESPLKREESNVSDAQGKGLSSRRRSRRSVSAATSNSAAVSSSHEGGALSPKAKRMTMQGTKGQAKGSGVDLDSLLLLGSPKNSPRKLDENASGKTKDTETLPSFLPSVSSATRFLHSPQNKNRRPATVGGRTSDLLDFFRSLDGGADEEDDHHLSTSSRQRQTQHRKNTDDPNRSIDSSGGSPQRSRKGNEVVKNRISLHQQNSFQWTHRGSERRRLSSLKDGIDFESAPRSIALMPAYSGTKLRARKKDGRYGRASKRGPPSQKTLKSGRSHRGRSRGRSSRSGRARTPRSDGGTSRCEDPLCGVKAPPEPRRRKAAWGVRPGQSEASSRQPSFARDLSKSKSHYTRTSDEGSEFSEGDSPMKIRSAAPSQRAKTAPCTERRPGSPSTILEAPHEVIRERQQGLQHRRGSSDGEYSPRVRTNLQYDHMRVNSSRSRSLAMKLREATEQPLQLKQATLFSPPSPQPQERPHRFAEANADEDKDEGPDRFNFRAAAAADLSDAYTESPKPTRRIARKGTQQSEHMQRKLNSLPSTTKMNQSKSSLRAAVAPPPTAEGESKPVEENPGPSMASPGKLMGSKKPRPSLSKHLLIARAFPSSSSVGSRSSLALKSAMTSSEANSGSEEDKPVEVDALSVSGSDRSSKLLKAYELDSEDDEEEAEEESADASSAESHADRQKGFTDNREVIQKSKSSNDLEKEKELLNARRESIPLPRGWKALPPPAPVLQEGHESLREDSSPAQANTDHKEIQANEGSADKDDGMAAFPQGSPSRPISSRSGVQSDVSPTLNQTRVKKTSSDSSGAFRSQPEEHTDKSRISATDRLSSSIIDKTSLLPEAQARQQKHRAASMHALEPALDMLSKISNVRDLQQKKRAAERRKSSQAQAVRRKSSLHQMPQRRKSNRTHSTSTAGLDGVKLMLASLQNKDARSNPQSPFVQPQENPTAEIQTDCLTPTAGDDFEEEEEDSSGEKRVSLDVFQLPAPADGQNDAATSAHGGGASDQTSTLTAHGEGTEKEGVVETQSEGEGLSHAQKVSTDSLTLPIARAPVKVSSSSGERTSERDINCVTVECSGIGKKSPTWMAVTILPSEGESRSRGVRKGAPVRERASRQESVRSSCNGDSRASSAARRMTAQPGQGGADRDHAARTIHSSGRDRTRQTGPVSQLSLSELVAADQGEHSDTPSGVQPRVCNRQVEGDGDFPSGSQTFINLAPFAASQTGGFRPFGSSGGSPSLRTTRLRQTLSQTQRAAAAAAAATAAEKAMISPEALTRSWGFLTHRSAADPSARPPPTARAPGEEESAPHPSGFSRSPRGRDGRSPRTSTDRGGTNRAGVTSSLPPSDRAPVLMRSPARGPGAHRAGRIQTFYVDTRNEWGGRENQGRSQGETETSFPALPMGRAVAFPENPSATLPSLAPRGGEFNRWRSGRHRSPGGAASGSLRSSEIDDRPGDKEKNERGDGISSSSGGEEKKEPLACPVDAIPVSRSQQAPSFSPIRFPLTPQPPSPHARQSPGEKTSATSHRTNAIHERGAPRMAATVAQWRRTNRTATERLRGNKLQTGEFQTTRKQNTMPTSGEKRVPTASYSHGFKLKFEPTQSQSQPLPSHRSALREGWNDAQEGRGEPPDGAGGGAAEEGISKRGEEVRGGNANKHAQQGTFRKQERETDPDSLSTYANPLRPHRVPPGLVSGRDRHLASPVSSSRLGGGGGVSGIREEEEAGERGDETQREKLRYSPHASNTKPEKIPNPRTDMPTSPRSAHSGACVEEGTGIPASNVPTEGKVVDEGLSLLTVTSGQRGRLPSLPPLHPPGSLSASLSLPISSRTDISGPHGTNSKDRGQPVDATLSKLTAVLPIISSGRGASEKQATVATERERERQKENIRKQRDHPEEGGSGLEGPTGNPPKSLSDSHPQALYAEKVHTTATAGGHQKVRLQRLQALRQMKRQSEIRGSIDEPQSYLEEKRRGRNLKEKYSS